MKRFLWSLALGAAAAAAVLAAPSHVLAQDAEAEAADPNTGGLTLTGGVDLTTAYFFRGYNQEDQGIILQPYATLTASVLDGENVDVNGYVGIWNSFHDEKTLAAGTGPSTWYESDLFAGVDLVLGKITLGTVYTWYTYPNGAFNTIQEIGFKITYDDTDFMKNRGLEFALKPYAAVYLETSDGNGTEDTYAEVGITPSFALGESGITLAVPVVIGFSIDEFYLDDTGDNEPLGYGSIGLFASLPIGEPGRLGTWTLTGGVQYLQLFADSTEIVNNGDDSEIIGKLGVSFAY